MKANNFFVGRKLRDITKTSGVEMPVTEQCVPVIVLNPTDAPVEVLPAFTKPNVNQELLTYTDRHTNTGGETNVQICTVDTDYDYYYLGFNGSMTAGSTALYIGDQTADAIDRTNAGTTCIYNQDFANAGYTDFMLPIPLKLKNGLRTGTAVGTGTGIFIHYYIKEKKIKP